MTPLKTSTGRRPVVLIIGAGFGGLFAARSLAGTAVDVILIDRHNYHTFTPLLYQVATAGLDPSHIAYPVRAIFRRDKNVRFLMGEVEAIDTAAREVTVRANGDAHRLQYDALIAAAGSVTHYFGLEQTARHAFGLKELSEAVILRNHILKQFEQAAWSDDPAYREASTTLVVVGGGPTGIETAGALLELSRHVLQNEFTGATGSLRPRVILVEASDRLLASYPVRLQEAARRQLQSLGVEVILGEPVEQADGERLLLKGGQIIPTRTVIWSAGVRASPLAAMLGVPLTPAGRVPVRPTLEVAGLPDVYAVGDMAYVQDGQGDRYPMNIPVAEQQGTLAARNILRRLASRPQESFRYHDRGIMATIGRQRAVAWLYNRVPLSGYPAWLTWLVMHLLWLMGFRNRISVLVNWVWNYLTYDRSARIILEHGGLRRRAEHDALLPPERTVAPEHELEIARR